MQIDRIIFPITSLGPGERLIIWTVGCSIRCSCCSNPELWRSDPDKDINVYELINTIKQAIGSQKIDGITITGGEPLEQIGELIEILPLLSKFTDDVLLYTGHCYEEITKSLKISELDTLRQYVSVLIDGCYRENLNDNSCTLKGSTNQNLHFFSDSFKEKYTEYMAMGRTVQNVFYGDKVVSVGIHNKLLL